MIQAATNKSQQNENQFDSIIENILQKEKLIVILQDLIDESVKQENKLPTEPHEKLIRTINDHIKEKEIEKALKICEINLKENPKLEKVNYFYLMIVNNLIRSFLINNHWKGIIPICDKLIIKGENIEIYYYLKAISYFVLGKTDKAINTFEKLTTINPNSDLAYTPMALAYLSLSKIDKSIEMLEKAIQINPKNDNPHWLLGLIFIHLEKDEESLVKLNEAVNLNPNNNLTNFLLVLVNLLLKNKRQAVRAFKKVRIDQIINQQIHKIFSDMLLQPTTFSKEFEERIAVLIDGILGSIVK